MKNLILHIGSHKTGTTSIQKALQKSKSELNKNEHDFFIINRQGKSLKNKGNTSSWIPGNANTHANTHPDLFQGIGLKVSSPEALAESLNDSEYDNIIMSAENFSWIYDDDEIKRLHSFLSKFFRVRIIVYLRRQDTQIISHHQQGSNSRRLPAYGYYGGTSKAIPHDRENYDEYLDYNNRLSKWAKHFGMKNMIVRIFEKDRLKNNDVVSDFLDAIGLSHADISSMRINESKGFERTKIGHLLNIANLTGPLSKIIRQGTNNSGKSLPSRTDAIDFYERYRKSNIELNEKFKICPDNEAIFDDDFSSYPSTSQDLWNEDNSNEAILHVFKALKNLDNLDPDVLTFAAVKLEKEDLKLSFELMKMARLLAPKDPLIKNKVAEYKRVLHHLE